MTFKKLFLKILYIGGTERQITAWKHLEKNEQNEK